ncbi:GTP 3',8-cyclase MoaA [Synechococcus sp. H55.5]|uniref:GTP 3',8-cyclase MoaA n=1 Tax=unclassified Synechococcus TaxID=2626047 RepID=UPI0039C2F65A
MQLVDQWNRRIRKLRVSLTDQCNLRCRYCMPLYPEFMDKSSYLSPQQYKDIIGELLDYGIEEVRITGGEPLVRREFAEIMQGLAELKIPSLSLTTNGVLLHLYWDVLKAANAHNLNISLDSLQPATEAWITHRDCLADILRNIREGIAQGFSIKLNTVLMRGVNDHELFDFVEFARETGVTVRFLELMRIGYANHIYDERYISAQECIARLKERYTLTQLPTVPDSTAFYFTVDGAAKIGFIASESQPFCSTCSRWRLTADGHLFACLFTENGLPIRDATPAQRRQIYQQLLGMKPMRRVEQVLHPMYSLGG